MNDEIDITTDGATIRPDDSDPQNNLTATKRTRGRPRKDGLPSGSVPKVKREKLSKEVRSRIARINAIHALETKRKNGTLSNGGRKPGHAEGRMPTQCMTVREIDHDMIAKWAQIHDCTISAMVRKIVEFYYTHEGNV